MSLPFRKVLILSCPFSPPEGMTGKILGSRSESRNDAGVPRLPSTSLYSERQAAPSEGPGSQGQGTEPEARSKSGPSPKATASLVRPTGETPLVITGSWVVCQDTAAFWISMLYRLPGHLRIQTWVTYVRSGLGLKKKWWDLTDRSNFFKNYSGPWTYLTSSSKFLLKSSAMPYTTPYISTPIL